MGRRAQPSLPQCRHGGKSVMARASMPQHVNAPLVGRVAHQGEDFGEALLIDDARLLQRAAGRCRLSANLRCRGPQKATPWCHLTPERRKEVRRKFGRRQQDLGASLEKNGGGGKLEKGKWWIARRGTPFETLVVVPQSSGRFRAAACESRPFGLYGQDWRHAEIKEAPRSTRKDQFFLTDRAGVGWAH
jgi:hypothetical protein